MQNKTPFVQTGSQVHIGLATKPWQKGILATAAALALLSVSIDAQALALGAVTVRSSLGEPLRAEIEVPQISSEEASALQASMASPQAFKSAGVDYNAALSGARVTLHRRANGQAYLRVTGNKPINEPFLGMVIEANWGKGRVVRDYTMLVDPPGRAAPPPVTVTQSQTTPPAQTQAPAPVAPAAAPPVAVQTTPSPAPDTDSATVARRAEPAERAARPSRRRTSAPAAAPAEAGGGAQVNVQRGDTAYGIASANAMDGVSLDQMLVAMLRANPRAFIGGNVNRMRAGAVINMPTAEQASAVSRKSARRAVVAQTRDFNAFRRGLASRTHSTHVASASRRASGGVQTQVQESRAPVANQDRLTLSKSGAPTGSESRVAQSRQAREQAERTAELNRNISELASLQAASGAAPVTPGINVPAAGTAPATPAPATPASVAASAVANAADLTASAADAAANAASIAASEALAGAAAVAAAASEAQAASEPASAEDAVAAEAPAPVAPPAAAPAPAPVAEPSFLDGLMENPLVPIAGAGLLALLAGYGVYRSRQAKKKAALLDSAFIESRLQPDSFFGASGGQRVNTKEGDGNSGSGSSSMAYSPSQLDAAGDVDPVAEADVYLAYGRDMQAEEILKEALRTQPGRAAIYRNLAGIYAKRRDARALEAIASEAYGVTQGKGADWQAITNLGSELDPNNQLYKPGGTPVIRTSPVPIRNFGADTEPQTAQLDRKSDPSSSVPRDLDLDRDNAPARPAAPVAAAISAAAGAAGTVATATASSSAPAEQTSASAAPSPSSAPIDFDLDLAFSPPSDPGAHTSPTNLNAPTPAPSAAEATTAPGMIDFDMNALSVDPDSRSGTDIKTEQYDDADEDPLGTKLALAREFHAIGDTDGARSMVKEVIAESSGTLRARAERLLAELS